MTPISPGTVEIILRAHVLGGPELETRHVMGVAE